MPPLVRALRPQEWIKNLLVFAGVLFSGRLDQSGALGDAVRIDPRLAGAVPSTKGSL